MSLLIAETVTDQADIEMCPKHQIRRRACMLELLDDRPAAGAQEALDQHALLGGECVVSQIVAPGQLRPGVEHAEVGLRLEVDFLELGRERASVVDHPPPGIVGIVLLPGQHVQQGGVANTIQIAPLPFRILLELVQHCGSPGLGLNLVLDLLDFLTIQEQVGMLNVNLRRRGRRTLAEHRSNLAACRSVPRLPPPS